MKQMVISVEVHPLSRQRRKASTTSLAVFLNSLLREKRISVAHAAAIAGCAPSVLHSWLNGSYPAESIGALRNLANHFGYSLAEAVCGQPDQVWLDIVVGSAPEASMAVGWVLRLRVQELRIRKPARLIENETPKI